MEIREERRAVSVNRSSASKCAAWLTALAMLCGMVPPGLPAALAEEDEPDYTANVRFTFTDEGITAEGVSSGCKVKDNTLTVNAAGTYAVTGSCEDGSITVAKDLTGVVLILSDLTLSCTTAAPIVVKKNSEVTLFAMGTNTLTNLEGEEPSEDDENYEDYEGAAIKAKSGASLTVEGSGTLNLVNSYKNGIKGGAETAVTLQMNTEGGALNVTAKNHGVASDGEVIVNSGAISITAENEGIKSSPDEDDTASDGTVTITGGTIKIDAGGDGIQAENGVTITGGTFDIDADGDGIQSNADLTITGGTFDIQTLNGYGRSGFDEDSMSCKGIKASASDDDTEDADNTITITGGTFALNTADDAIHSDGYAVITGGVFDIYTGDDGVHADTSLTLGTDGGNDRDPWIKIWASYEGLEAGNVYLLGGKHYVIAEDDGINAAGGSSDGTDPGGPGGGPGGGGQGGPGQDHFNSRGGPGGFLDQRGGDSAEDYSLNISGGLVYVECEGDGLDSNGALNLSGGEIEVWSQSSGDNEPLDYDGDLTVTGGTIFAAGCIGMGAASPVSGGQTYQNYQTSVSSGRLISLTDGGSVIYNAKAPKAVSYEFFSSSAMSSSCKLSASSGSASCALGSAFTHSFGSGKTSGGVVTYTCPDCGATETRTAETDTSETIAKTAVISIVYEETETTFQIENGTIDVYYSADSDTPEETGVTAAVPRTDGEIDYSGSGSVRFRVNPEEGYAVSYITTKGTCGDLLGWDDTGTKNLYEIPKIGSDLTVTVTLIADSETGFTAAFAAADEDSADHFSVTGFYTHNYEKEDETTYEEDIQTWTARNDATGGVDTSGSGQVNFQVVPGDGYRVKDVTVSGEYKKLKDQGDDVYRITQVKGDLTVSIALLRVLDLSLWAGQSVKLPYSVSSAESDDETVVSVMGGTVSALAEGSATLTVTLSDESTAVYAVAVSAEPDFLTLPSALTEIGENAFADASAVTFVTLGEKVQTVGGNAFSGSGLAQIQVTSSETAFDDTAFGDLSPVLLCPEGSEAAEWAEEKGYVYVYPAE